jgi:hypothetical protein
VYSDKSVMSTIVGVPLYLWNPQRYGYSTGNGYCAFPAIARSGDDDLLDRNGVEGKVSNPSIT